MRNTEANTLAELIEDSTEVPQELRGAVAGVLPESHPTAPWRVDDANYDQVADLEVYV